ncbi:MAG: LysM peptidoglycan-binding domain-containing protein [Ignavibacteriae bacterium]|nr:MAG: LysM peptidoglycan-binding domain-containing protein [Ignavibacteriota bacterium]
MHIKFFFLTAFILIFSFCVSYSQDDIDELSTEEWEFLRDELAVKVIKLMTTRDSLNNEIDSLTGILTSKEEDLEKCDNELLALVGISRIELVEFRRKFEETEKKINNRSSSPEDIRNNYYDEISSSKILCLPEFSDRFLALRNKFQPGMQEEKQPQYTGGNYLVVKGDCLWNISKQKLGSPVLWPVLWEMNRTGVLNKDSLPTYQQTVNNPNLIYPGQVLRIPTLTEAQEKLESSLKELRKSKYRRNR